MYIYIFFRGKIALEAEIISAALLSKRAEPKNHMCKLKISQNMK